MEMAAAALMRCALRFLHAEARGWQGSLATRVATHLPPTALRGVAAARGVARLTQVVPVAIVSALAQLCAPNEF